MPQGNPFTSAMAPAAMAGIAPDLAADQTQLLRQQQLADLLRRQGMEPMGPTEMVSGWAVKKSPLEGVSKIAQALGGQYLASQADERQLALSQALRQRQLDSFDSVLGATGGGNQAAQAVQQWGDANGDSGPPNPALVQQVQQAMPQQAPEVTRLINSAREAYRAGNTELANKLAMNLLELTGNQKDWAAQGQDPRQVGREQQAERLGKAMYKMDPGTTTINMLTGAREFQPRVGEGITLNNGVAGAVPGYADANAEIAGRQAGAVSGAQAQNKLITVNTPKGPVMKTEAQAVQEAGGGAPTNVGNMRPPGASKGFQKFDTPEQGLAAMDAQLKRYGDQGHNTLEKIISRWSPPNENDTPRLVAAAAKRLGIDPKAPLDLNNPVIRQAVGMAIALQERPLSAHNGGAKQEPGIKLKGTEIPESAVKEQQAILDKIAIAGSTNADLGAIVTQLDEGKLKLGPMKNLAGEAKNYLGISDENSQNLVTLKATLEKLRNDSLRLNAGVHTDKDAQNAWKELITNLHDPKVVRKRLVEIQSLNERAANQQRLQIEIMRKNFGAGPLDTKQVYNQPAAVGGGGSAKFEVGKTYIDAKGNKATYQADGTWK